MLRPHVKICGLRSEAMVDEVLSRGSSQVGFVHFEPSPRHLAVDEIVRLRAYVGGRALVTVVLVDPVDALLETLVRRVRPDLIQLHGSEGPARIAEVQALTGLPVMKALSVAGPADLEGYAAMRAVADRVLIDAKRRPGDALPGGNGRPFDWRILDGLPADADYMLSGGLNPDNVGEAIRRLAPRGLDVSSGVERAPGVKDAGLIHRLFDAIDEACELQPMRQAR